MFADPTGDASTVKLIVAPTTAAPPVVRVSVAERVTGPEEPNGTEAGLGADTVKVVATVAVAVKVAVNACALLPIAKSQGEVVPVQFVDPAGDPVVSHVPLHPAKTEPGLAVAVIFPAASLSRLGSQGLPVQLKLVGAGLISEPATVPPPVPAKVIVNFLASLNAVCAVNPEV